MRKKIVISLTVVALLLIGVMATSVLASDPTFTKNTTVSKELQANIITETAARLANVKESTQFSVKPNYSVIPVSTKDIPIIVSDEVETVPEVDIDSLRNAVPSSYEETDACVTIQRARFLLYTDDGKHIMWGFVGNGYFVGTDNLNKRCWGIYGKGVFAGFYDGEFFWGKYRCGNWKAEGLFRLNHGYGKYILFPETTIKPAVTAVEP